MAGRPQNPGRPMRRIIPDAPFLRKAVIESTSRMRTGFLFGSNRAQLVATLTEGATPPDTQQETQSIRLHSESRSEVCRLIMPSDRHPMSGWASAEKGWAAYTATRTGGPPFDPRACLRRRERSVSRWKRPEWERQTVTRGRFRRSTGRHIEAVGHAGDERHQR